MTSDDPCGGDVKGGAGCNCTPPFASDLPAPECEGGYTNWQLAEILGNRLDKFEQWMRGQTMMLCEGRSYDHDRCEYVPACGGVAHGGIVYRWDLERFLDGRPVID
jgi:hypothetical protein